MQDSPRYENLVGEIRAWFGSALERALVSGIAAERIFLDPGIGFGKTLNDNLRIISRLAEFCGTDYPILVGLSRKSFIGEITGRPLEERLPGTLAANAAAISGGARIIRVHDVKEHVDLVKILHALRGAAEF